MRIRASRVMSRNICEVNMTDELELEERIMAQEFAHDLAKDERLEMFRTCRYCGKCEVTKLSANWWAPKFWCKEEISFHRYRKD